MTRFHITQDEHGYWMRVREQDNWLEIEAWGSEYVDHVLHETFDRHAEDEFEVYYSEAMPESDRRIGDPEYVKPKPRRASEPYTVHNTRDDTPEER